MVRCIHQHDARHPHRITPHRNRFPQNSLRRNGCERNHFTCYPSMKEMGREERLKPSHQHWLILQLKHPDRVWLHNLRARQHRGNDFMKVPFANSSALSQLPVFLNSLAITDTAVPPIHAPFTPVHHSVTKQYYRQLSAEELPPRIHLPYYTQTRRRISQ